MEFNIIVVQDLSVIVEVQLEIPLAVVAAIPATADHTKQAEAESSSHKKVTPQQTWNKMKLTV